MTRLTKKQITKKQITKKLRLHQLWLYGDPRGEKADFQGANLRKANLIYANLRKANLMEADLREANLYKADLAGANLYKADLAGANFEEADLNKADLSKADLQNANLIYANLRKANLMEADLSRVNLSNANLIEANLVETNLMEADITGTCLDPNNTPNMDVGGFTQEDDYCVGYRTRNSYFMNKSFKYEDNKTYKAPVFSTSDTLCHPGLYVFPTKEDIMDYCEDKVEIIKVLFLKEDCHKAGNKWRVQKFRVVGEVVCTQT